MWQGDGTVADPSPSPGSAPLRAGLLGLALVAALALLAATFSDVIVVTLGGRRTLAADTGWDRHGPALLLLGLACAVLGVLAWRGTRIAAAGLILVGVTVVLIVLLGDVGDLHTTGAIAGSSENATTDPGSGFFLESLGGVLAVLAGGGFLLAGRTPPPPDSIGRR